MQRIFRSALRQKTIQRFHGHYKGYNEPSGTFLNMPKAPPGYRRVKQPWEFIYFYLFGGSWLLFFIGMFYKPESEIESWAKEEAMLRIKERGENWDSEGKPY